MAKRRPWIAYVAPIDFPEGGAAARRILGNAKALAAVGYDVIIVSGQPPGAPGKVVEIAPGISCASVNERHAEHLPKALRYARYATMGARSRRWVDAQPYPPLAVIVYSGYSPYLLQFMTWRRLRGIALLFDAVEWYAARSIFGFLVSPYLWNTEFAMRVLIPRLDGVVVISSALETYYHGRGAIVGRIPPLFDPAEIRPSLHKRNRNGPLVLVYSGSPGRKDLLDTVIEAIIRRDATGSDLRLDIVGLSDADLRERRPLHNCGGVIPSCLVAHGKVTHTRSMELIAQADFSVFLRHVTRVSTHGFPTKFVESLAVGTPVITNITSDLREHLRDGETGLICPEPTLAALETTLNRALSLSVNHRHIMREAARAEAERAFDHKKHVATLDLLIHKSVINSRR